MIVIPEEIKSLFRKDSIRKNIRIHFPNGEQEDIVNDQLVEESFAFTESICSREKLKFGLCEANVVEFDCVGIKNIKGCEIEVFCEIDISSLPEEFITEYGKTSEDVAFPYYQIPFGVFIVDSCKRQTDMKQRKVVAYGKEIQEEAFLNPVEYAKFKGELYCNNKDSYHFNVFAFLYANVYKEYRSEYFQEKEMVNIENDSIIGLNTTHTTGNLSIYTLYKLIKFNGDNQEYLYELEYESVEENKIRETAEKILSTLKEYENFLVEREDVYNICEKLKEVYFLDEINGSVITLKDYHYLYPYMGYSGVESNSIPYVVMIPYGVYITIYEEIEAGSVNSKYFSYKIRDEEKISCHKVTGLPSIYMTYERTAEKKNGVTRYYLSNPEMHPRSIMEATMEFMTMFGRYGRNGEFKLFKIEDYFGLYPSETLYPSEDLFPRKANAGILTRSSYTSAWYDDELTKPYDRVSVTYKNEDGEDVYAYCAIVDEEMEGYDESKYQTYSLSDNYLVKNATFTAEQIEEILAGVAENIKNIRYMPADIELIGLPWIEAGDVITVITEDGAIETCILRRTLTGIQSLEDNFESKG